MGEQQKHEEPKAEVKKEEKAVEKPSAEEEKPEPEPEPPTPLILSVDLHCIGCAKKIEKSLLRIRGVVGVETDMVKNQVMIKGVVEPEEVCNQIMKKTKRNAKVLSPVPVAHGEPIPQEVAPQDPGLNTVELNVNMHCEACAEQLRRKILKMKGVSKVETELRSGKARVVGTMDSEKLVEYVYRRTKKQAKIVPQAEPEKAEEEEKKKGEKGAGEEVKEKKEDGGEKGVEEDQKEGEVVQEKGCDEEEEEERMQSMMYNYQYYYPPVYVMERIPAPQLFSDENPNACSIC